MQSIIDFPIIFNPVNDSIQYPAYSTRGASGLDLSANIDSDVIIPPFESRVIPTGISIDMNSSVSATALDNLQERLLASVGNSLFSKIYYKTLLWLERKCLGCIYSVIADSIQIEAQIRSKSTLAMSNLFVLNSPSTIDRDFQGELSVIIYNADKDKAFTITPGMHVAQLVFQEVIKPSFNRTSDFNYNSERSLQGLEARL